MSENSSSPHVQPPADRCFSVVTPVYDVERYLPEYLDSLRAQTFGFENLDVVLVDDGSNDGTLRVAQEAAAQHPNVRVITQANAGQGAAREAGLALVRNPWVTFPDPDDVLEPDYFAHVHAFMCSEEGVGADLYGTRVVQWFEGLPDGGLRGHPLDGKFEQGSRRVDLVEEGLSVIQGQVATSIFRVDRLRELDLRFEPRLRARFEDGHFTSRYLLSFARPVLGLVEDARYLYRKRTDGTSTIQQAYQSAAKSADVFEHGYLHLLQTAAAHGEVPSWLQTFVVYELYWTMRSTQRVGSPTVRPDPEVGDRMVDLLRRICALLDPEVVRRYGASRIDPWIRYSLQHSFADVPGRPTRVRAEREADGPLLKLQYYYTGELPAERWLSDGTPVEPDGATERVYEGFGHELMRQRIVWVDASKPLTVELDGRLVPVTFMGRRFKRGVTLAHVRDEVLSELSPRQRYFLPDALAERAAAAGTSARAADARPTLADRVLKRRWARARRRGTYRDAWLLMDRVDEAADSGEVLYFWIRDNRPDVNVWFVVGKDSPEWARLSALGVRLLAYGSREHTIALLEARHVISSHADRAITHPVEHARFGPPRWSFTFLQHGVIKGDLSRWLNPKRITRFVTSAQGEHDFIAGPSPYAFGTRETVLTGLPRFDALVQKAAASGEPRRVLFAPTWRYYLEDRGENAHEAFTSSDFWRSWRGLLEDPRVREALEQRNLRPTLFLHPRVRSVVDPADIPAGVEPIMEVPADIQQYVAESRLLVTDYSSMAFNAAYLDRPTVYFQFDRDRYMSGEHTELPGWFDYDRDGLGPVALDRDSAVKAVLALLDEPERDASYSSVFAHHDAEASRRVHDVVQQIGPGLLS